MATAPAELGSRCEFRTYHTIPKKDGEMTTKKVAEPFGKQPVSGGVDGPYALVIKRTFSAERPSEASSITLGVNSPHILAALRQVVGGDYPTIASDFTAPVELASPFQVLMHHWDGLDAYRQASDSDDARMHLALLFDFMEHELGPDRRQVLAMLRERKISYLAAWAMYRPGDLMYSQVLGQPWILRCEKTSYEESTTVGPYLNIYCSYTDHDGSLVGQAAHCFTIYQKRQFGGDNPAIVDELPVYPLEFVANREQLKETLVHRGQAFLDMKGVSVKAYDGLAQYLKQPPWSFYDPDMISFGDVWMPYTESGRVILDRHTFQSDMNNSQVALKKVSEPDTLLCPPFAIGFSLSRKCWCRFFVDSISDVMWKKDVWQSLILDEDEKMVLQALVSSHRYPENPRNQPEQKGKGLVILLHGAPGSGKTLTAEVSAEGTQKALITATMGDLNKENLAWLFEIELRKLLQYATAWKAVVLLDEADVFLEARDEQAGNAERNSLVAVFLKELEYFSGIVFLTTNRLASFDLAMKSRIHLALGYEAPGADVRRRIWALCLQKVPADESDVGDVDQAAATLVEGHRVNGREISNAINTARTMARFEGVPLRVSHIEKVLSVRAAFDRTLRDQSRKLTLASRKHTDPPGPGALLRKNSILEEPESYE